MTDANAIFDDPRIMPVEEVAKSQTPDGAELMARTGLRSNDTKQTSPAAFQRLVIETPEGDGSEQAV